MALREPLDGQLKQLMKSLHTLQHSLQQLTTNSDTADPSRKLIAQHATALLPQFLAILDALESTDIAPRAEQQIRPFQTEAHRRLRLIKTEAMRLQTARQPTTLEKSQTQLLAHLDALQQFAEAIGRTICEDVHEEESN